MNASHRVFRQYTMKFEFGWNTLKMEHIFTVITVWTCIMQSQSLEKYSKLDAYTHFITPSIYEIDCTPERFNWFHYLSDPCAFQLEMSVVIMTECFPYTFRNSKAVIYLYTKLIRSNSPTLVSRKP